MSSNLGGIEIERAVHEHLNGHRGGIVWFTGLSGSGKTTLSQNVEKNLIDQGFKCVVIDGDHLRAGLNRDLGFSEADREENLRRAAEVAEMFLRVGFIVLLPLISPSSEVREKIRLRYQPKDYVEIYVKCSLTACERRDPKGLYHKARRGEIRNFTGIDAIYEVPTRSELTIDTEYKSIHVCVTELTGLIINKFAIQDV
ncbi:adenylyl-sulfate kinase [Paenibacillus sp. EC2-1]|uniref:adenylyl-sulfate kinase n=1 Tax=Paenibacillus sp. EC2-1 TaxID=3388665 RepID=UPI003BEED564